MTRLVATEMEPVAAKFSRLKALWKRGTAFSSSLSKQYFHPAYQQIIGLGPAALPHIFAELRSEPDWWFWALHSITGENPVPPEAAGSLAKMTQFWLDWGTRHGISSDT